MPLIKREVQPTELSRGAIAPGIRNELECVTNNTLANVVRQLSSLSKHAEDMFGELFREANSFFHRANRLQERVERLKVKVTQLDSTVEEVSLQDINMRKPFKSSVIKDQQAITITTRPQAIVDTYRNCDAPPPLDKLNPYREDGKDSMKFYTDPTYFFELWCQEMQKDTEMQKKELKKRKKGRPKTGNERGVTRVRQIKTRKDEYAAMAKGKEFMPEREHRNSGNYSDGQTPSRPSSLELNQQFMAQQGYPGQNYTGQIPNQGHPPGHAPPQGQGQYAHTNGPVGGPGVNNNYAGQMTQQQYQYNHNHNVDYNTQQQLQHQAGGGHYDAAMMARQQGQQGSPAQSPSKQRMPSSRSMEKMSSPRPSQPPPAPPGQQLRDSPLSGPPGASRDSLPPPPPPPPNDPTGQQQQNMGRGGGPQYGSAAPGQPLHMNHVAGLRDSPIRNLQQQSHSPSPQHHTKSSTPDSIDLPPPPPPPPVGQTPDTPGSMSSMPPPPPTPPPPDMYHAHHGGLVPAGGTGAPAPPPPPPPPSGGGRMPNGNIPGGGHLAAHHQPDAASLASSASTKSDPEPKAPVEPVKDERSDLLAAIRQGIQLRKVEEKRVKEEKKKHSVSGLDVQSIMEAAFEMRRKALEANEDEDEDPDSDVAWDSDEAEC